MLRAPTSAAHRIRGLTAAQRGASHGAPSFHWQARQQRGSCSHRPAALQQQRSWQGASCVLMCRRTRSTATAAAAQQSQQTSAAAAEDLLIVGALMWLALLRHWGRPQPATFSDLEGKLCACLQAQASWGAMWASCGGSSTPARPWSDKPTLPTTTHGEAPRWPPAQLCISRSYKLCQVCECSVSSHVGTLPPTCSPPGSTLPFLKTVVASRHDDVVQSCLYTAVSWHSLQSWACTIALTFAQTSANHNSAG